MKFDTAIIDMDIIVCRCGYAIQKYDKEEDILIVEPVHHGYYNINSMMNQIFVHTGCTTQIAYLSGPGEDNYRYKIDSTYKSNRKDTPKPIHFHDLREYCIKKWGADITLGQEADDICSIRQYELNPLGFDPEVKNSILCSIDKDFNNIPGWHFNMISNEVYYVNPKEALQNFYLQILTGDPADGIPRIKKGWRQKEAEEKLKKAETEEEMLKIVQYEIEKVVYTDSIERSLTNSQVKELIQEDILRRGRLLWLRTKLNEMWEPLKSGI